MSETSLTHNNHQQERTVNLSNLRKRTVAEANRLIESVAKMSTISLKLFEIAVSGTDSQNSSTIIKIKRAELYDALKLTSRHRSRDLTKFLKDLQKNSAFSYSYQDDQGYRHDARLVPISLIDNGDDGYVKINFTPEIMPYITELKKNFTRYQLDDLLRLDNSHAVILYRWLMMNYRQYQYYVAGHQRTLDQLEKYRNPQTSLQNFREKHGLEDKYPSYKDLDRYVVKPAVKQITELTRYNVTYDKLKNGRRIVALRFHITAKEIQIPNREVNDSSQRSSKTALTAFVADPTVQIMLGAHLVDATKSVSDADYRDEIMTQLVPAYQAFEQQYGETALRKHLNYVGAHLPVKVDNLTNYLLKALQDYETKKRQDAKKSKPQRHGSRSNIKEELPDWAKHPETVKDDKPSAEAVAEVKAMIAEFDRNYGDKKPKQD